jgi:Ca-activated chloride channel family protein
MLHFAYIGFLALLPLPWIIPYVLPAAKPGEQAALKVPFFQRLQALGGMANVGAGLQRWQCFVAYFIWILLVLAAASPQWLGEPYMLKQEGRNIMLAIDLSGSMQIPDMVLDNKEVDRLQMIKAVAGDFIDQRVGDRLGLVLFGTRAYLQTPLTFDRKTVHAMLNDATIGLAGQMTDIGDAMGLAIKRLMQYPAQSRVLVLLTDGANNSGSVSPLEAAKMAEKQNIKIYTIGIGSEQAIMQTFFGPQMVNPAADLDEHTLRQIAAMTGGQYFRAKDGASLQQIYQWINQLQPITADQKFFRPIKELYPWPLALALLLSLVLAQCLCGIELNLRMLIQRKNEVSVC